MDHRESVFGECDGEDGEFDVGRSAEKLLLFERIVLRSNRLQELPALARAIGADALTKLLNRGAVTFDCSAYGLGSTDHGTMSFELRFLHGEDDAGRDARLVRTVLKQCTEVHMLDAKTLPSRAHLSGSPWKKRARSLEPGDLALDTVYRPAPHAKLHPRARLGPRGRQASRRSSTTSARSRGRLETTVVHHVTHEA